MESESLQVKLEVFEGPLDLLLHLIKKNKLDIYDIPIVEITEQYLAYLAQWDQLNMEVASEFIVMAATLINLKAKKLLPSAEQEEEEEEDAEANLVRRLLVYQQYKEASAKLLQSQRPADRLVFLRDAEEIRGQRPLPSVPDLLKDVSLEEMRDLCALLLKNQKESIDEQRASFKAVHREIYRVADKISQLREKMTKENSVSFFDLRRSSDSKEESITYFMAMLELSRMNEVVLRQKKPFEDIVAEKKTTEEHHEKTQPETGNE